MNHPIRSESHKIDEKSILLIQSTIVDNWIARSQEGRDYGIDLQIERFDGENPTGDFIFAQVKGTKSEFSNPPKLSNFPIKTINYALMFSVPFFVFYTSLKSKKTKFVWLQKYTQFYLDKNNPKWKSQKTITIEFPDENDLESNIQKIISISNKEKRIKVAHRYLMLFERLLEFNKKLTNGDYKAAKVCKTIFYEIVKIGGLEEFGGKLFLAPDENSRKKKIISLFMLYEKVEKSNKITEQEIQEIKICEQAMAIGKLEALNIETHENIAFWLDGTLPY